MDSRVVDITEYNPKEHNGLSFMEHILTSRYPTNDERLAIILDWANLLSEIDNNLENLFICKVRQMLFLTPNNITDSVFVVIYKFYLELGGKEI